MATPQPRYKRRIKLIRPRLQLKLVTVFAGIAVLALLLQCLLFYRTMAAMALLLPNDGLLVMSEVNSQLGQILLLSLGVLLPATFWIGILVTFRVAGPVYRLETYLKQVARGDRPEDCRLRRGDELVELCAAVNEATRPLRQPGEDVGLEQREAA